MSAQAEWTRVGDTHHRTLVPGTMGEKGKGLVRGLYLAECKGAWRCTCEASGEGGRGGADRHGVEAHEVPAPDPVKGPSR